jgi:uncharacterized protein involved in exopolysaccharide biosynthesis
MTKPPTAAARHSSPNGEQRGQSPAGTGTRGTVAPEAHLGAPAPRRAPTTAELRRLVLLSLLIVLVGAGAGFGGAMVWPATYAARAEILYEITQEKPTGFLRDDRSLTTQLVLMRSRRVLAPVAARSGIPVIDLEKKVSITVLDNSEIIRVEARNHLPDTALRWVREIVDGYEKAVPADEESGVDAFLRQQLTDVQARLAKARAQAAQLRAQPDRGAVESARAIADADVQPLADREQKLQGQLDDLHVAELRAPRHEVTVQPYLVADPVSPRPVFAATAGALTGLVAAAVVCLLARRRTRGE